MIIRAEVFKKIGGFLSDLGPGAIGLGEETELSLRMRAAGYKLAFAPQIAARHRLSKKRLTKGFIRRRFFQQGRAAAYYAPLPVPLYRFGLYVVKETMVQEIAAIRHLCAGRQSEALRCQCEVRSHAGFFCQHYRFKKGLAFKASAAPNDISMMHELTKNARVLGRD